MNEFPLLLEPSERACKIRFRSLNFKMEKVEKKKKLEQ